MIRIEQEIHPAIVCRNLSEAIAILHKQNTSYRPQITQDGQVVVSCEYRFNAWTRSMVATFNGVTAGARIALAMHEAQTRLHQTLCGRRNIAGRKARRTVNLFATHGETVFA